MVERLNARRQHLDRRLRHRLLEPGLPEQAARRRAEDRPQLRPRPRDQRRRARRRRRARQAGARARPEGRRRGRRDRGAAPDPALFGCHELQGFLFARPMSARALSAWAMDDVGPRGARVPRLALPARPSPARCTRRPRLRPPREAAAASQRASYNRGMKSRAYTRAAALPQILKERIVVLDGAMGTMIQRYKLSEADYRGERFADHPKSLKGNNDLLSLTRPDVIAEIHEQYLAAGADIDRDQHLRRDLGRAGRLRPRRTSRARSTSPARDWRSAACDKFASADKPRFVAGALGPTPKTRRARPDVNDPAARNVTFDELRDAYREQARRAARRRLRPVPGRDDLRHAQRQGGALRARRADGRRPASGCR